MFCTTHQGNPSSRFVPTTHRQEFQQELEAVFAKIDDLERRLESPQPLGVSPGTFGASGDWWPTCLWSGRSSPPGRGPVVPPGRPSSRTRGDGPRRPGRGDVAQLGEPRGGGRPGAGAALQAALAVLGARRGACGGRNWTVRVVMSKGTGQEYDDTASCMTSL